MFVGDAVFFFGTTFLTSNLFPLSFYILFGNQRVILTVY